MALGGVVIGAGCLNRPLEVGAPVTTFINSQRATNAAVTKIDILLAIDNSSSMSDKQDLLAVAVPKLVDRLVSPDCVDKDKVPLPTPIAVTETCPAGYEREFPPILDINVGVISSSLGDLGDGACGDSNGGVGQNYDDKGQLVKRGASAPTDTYKGAGFLAWDPSSQRDPPGVSDPTLFNATLTELVRGVGEKGCGFEMPLESIYRFLADPAPYESVSNGVPSGTDTDLLDQRAAFLRPDSLVAVIVLSDENDCSAKVGGDAYTVLRGEVTKPGSGICKTDPANKCCYSCADAPPSGCAADCAGPTVSDETNLRCWNQKKRFGESFLYPVKRYVNAFSKPFIDPASADLSVTDPNKAVENPLFAGGRATDLVFVAGIVGVPWQAVAKDPNDISQGFEEVAELEKKGFFDAYVGDPDAFVEPTNPIAIESPDVRPGVPAGAPNGGDRPSPMTGNGKLKDLEYTCIYKLAKEDSAGSDCESAPVGNPICSGTTQTHGKAYPGLRELAVLEGLGKQGIPASICPANANPSDTSVPFGYGPAVNTIVNRLKEKLSPGCFNRKLKTDADGGAACLVVEATASKTGQVDCDAIPGRKRVAPDEVAAIQAIKDDPLANKDWNSFCAIPQLTNEPKPGGSSDRVQCQTLEAEAIPDSADVDGWCYIDASSVPPVGNPELSDFDKCPTNEQRLVRFVGDGKPASNGVTFITCVGEASE